MAMAHDDMPRFMPPLRPDCPAHLAGHSDMNHTWRWWRRLRLPSSNHASGQPFAGASALHSRQSEQTHTNKVSSGESALRRMRCVSRANHDPSSLHRAVQLNGGGDLLSLSTADFKCSELATHGQLWIAQRVRGASL